MWKMSIWSSRCISSTLKHNVIKLNYYRMIAHQKETPTAAFLASISQYEKYFPETSKSIISYKLSNILNPNFVCVPVHAENTQHPELNKIISSD